MQITIDSEILATLAEGAAEQAEYFGELAKDCHQNSEPEAAETYEEKAADYEHAAEIARALLYNATMAAWTKTE